MCWAIKISKTLEDTGIGKDCLNRIPKAQQIIPRINTWDHTKLKRFCTTKETTDRMKRMGKICQLFIGQINI